MMERYIAKMRNALRYPGARDLYFPPDKKARKAGNLRLARELGHGLADFTDALQKIQSLYGKLVVANSLDSTGVCIGAKEWMGEVRKTIHNVRYKRVSY